MPFPAAIIIPTWNRAHLIARAVEAALAQSHPDRIVIVVDDGSRDATADTLGPYMSQPDFVYARLARNSGTAMAKNVGILLAGDRAVTFHDSDDLPHRDKVLRQAMVLDQDDIGAHPCLNWALAGQTPGSRLRIGAVLSHHDLILPDGRRVTISRELSLVDDMFPNLQMGSDVPGDWTHVNSGLFHPALFARLGGFLDCIEEDREFRNRIILSGEIVWIIREPLLTKIETADSLTQSRATDYDSDKRRADRHLVWQRAEDWLRNREVQPVAIDLGDLAIAGISNPARLAPSPALATAQTRDMIRHAIRHGGRDA
ncbi:glycosyltransferase [Paracoccus pantotrophus]|uniref:Glycosyltransferase n=1 Tax=Paracoccus pantotrophus TaxID=82367 RepID=A0A7H9BXE8_PARPN|nr:MULTISPECIES: glycosyltransferase family 2 protein [Paracoccus]QLH16100.1 glycosyltransferase [Paracoccus pantotrophus]UFM65958.1 glycosyltransferase family 2 protein [Paracoccus sp. MA]